jgi:putative RecB family exonuclease
MTEAVGASAVEPAVGAAGPAEVPRRPALSPSRAADFKQCPLLYRFRAIDRLPEVPGPAQVRGTLVHAVLERLYALPAAERLPAAAHALVAPVWAELCAADPGLATALFGATSAPAPAGDPAAADTPPPDTAAADTRPADALPPDTAPADRAGTWLAGVAPLLDAYFALEDPRLLEPQAREQLVEVELESGLLLRGYVDRIDAVGDADDGQDRDDDARGNESRDDGVRRSDSSDDARGSEARDDRDARGSEARDASTGDDPAGDGAADDDRARDHRARDHRAGDYRVVDYKTGTAPGPAVEARALFQMKFYALVLLLLRGRAPRELRLMYLTGPVTLHYVPDEEQLLRFGRTLEAMWTAIRAAGATGDFRPNPGPSCAWCSHRALCPAWDGVPPPYPGWPTGPAATDPEVTDPAATDPEATDPAAAAGVPEAGDPAAAIGAGPPDRTAA